MLDSSIDKEKSISSTSVCYIIFDDNYTVDGIISDSTDKKHLLFLSSGNQRG